MHEGKTYKLKNGKISGFIAASTHNKDLVEKIDSCGGEFTVIELAEGFGSVCSVVFPNGNVKKAYWSGNEYFEIMPEEFKFFEEVVDKTVHIAIPKKYINLSVDESNWKEAVALIEKTFKN